MNNEKSYEYSLSVVNGNLMIVGTSEVDGVEGTFELELKDDKLPDTLRDLAEQLEHPEIVKCRIDICNKCGGPVDLYKFKLSDEDQEEKEAEVCRHCGIGQFDNKVQFKI